MHVLHAHACNYQAHWPFFPRLVRIVVVVLRCMRWLTWCRPELPDRCLDVIGGFLSLPERHSFSVTCFKCLRVAPNPDHTFIHFRVSSPAAGVTSFIEELTAFPHVHDLVGTYASLCCRECWGPLPLRLAHQCHSRWRCCSLIRDRFARRCCFGGSASTPCLADESGPRVYVLVLLLLRHTHARARTLTLFDMCNSGNRIGPRGCAFIAPRLPHVALLEDLNLGCMWPYCSACVAV